jgi:hypothetical protein
MLIEPDVDVVGVETDVVADLEVRDASLLDEPADVTLAGRKLLSEFGDVDQPRSVEVGSNPAALASA